jgi:hypothetical protein
MVKVIIDTLSHRENNSIWYKKNKWIPKIDKYWNLVVFCWIDDIVKQDFNKDYRFSISWLKNCFKLNYVVNTNEYYTELIKSYKIRKEYIISSYSLEWFKEELKNFLITKWIIFE